MSEGLELAERAVRAADGDEAQAIVRRESSGLARYAASEVHQPTLVENEVVELQVVRDGRLGIAVGNRPGEDGLRELAARAAEAAASAPADPDFPGLTPKTDPAEVEGYDAATAGLGAADQAGLAATAIDAADLDLYGFVTSGETELAIASTTGLSLSQTMTDAAVLALAAVEGASGYAEQSSWRIGGIDPAATAREAVAKAERTRGATEIEPGSYAAVLEPYAFAELLLYFSYDAFGSLGLLEERSFASGRIGEKVFDERFSLADDALDPRGFPKAFDFEGSPKQRVELVRDGVLEGVVWGRQSAARAGNGQQTTGHGPPSSLRHWGPLPYALSVAGGEAESAEELAELVGDGIYVTRPALPEHRQPARGHHHRHDARRDLPHPRRPGRRTARQPALHRLRAGAPGRAARPDPRAGVGERGVVLRRALPERRPHPGGRDRPLRRHRDRLYPRGLTAA